MCDTRPDPEHRLIGSRHAQTPLHRRTFLSGMMALAGAGVLSSPTAAPAATYLIGSLSQYQAALDDLAKTKAVALVDVGAEWCAFCRVIDDKIMPDRRVAKLMHGFGLLKIDITTMSDDNRALLRHLKVDGPPTVFIVDTRSGREHANTRSVGNFTTEHLIARLQAFAA